MIWWGWRRSHNHTFSIASKIPQRINMRGIIWWKRPRLTFWPKGQGSKRYRRWSDSSASTRNSCNPQSQLNRSSVPPRTNLDLLMNMRNSLSSQITKKRIPNLSYAGTSTPTYMTRMRPWRMMATTCLQYLDWATSGGQLQRRKGTERVNLRHLP